MPAPIDRRHHRRVAIVRTAHVRIVRVVGGWARQVDQGSQGILEVGFARVVPWGLDPAVGRHRPKRAGEKQRVGARAGKVGREWLAGVHRTESKLGR